MGLFTEEYKKLLIIQYADKPKALSTIESILAPLENVYETMYLLENAFDLDTAVGVQLDVIGKIVGISREVPFVLKKEYFSFDEHDFESPFGDRFKDIIAYPFKDKGEKDYTDGILNDADYRFFIKAKIVKNYSTGKVYDEDKISIQKALDYLYDGKAYITDNGNMTMNIYLDYSIDRDKLSYAQRLELIPKPQGVGYNITILYDDGKTFGFSDNLNSKGFNIGSFASKTF